LLEQEDFDSEINLIWAAVDRVLAKHVQDPNLVPLAARHDWLREAYKKRKLEELPTDVVRAFDRLSRCERERDRLTSKIIALERKLDMANLKIWVLTALVISEGGALGWLAKALLSRLH